MFFLKFSGKQDSLCFQMHMFQLLDQSHPAKHLEMVYVHNRKADKKGTRICHKKIN